MDRREFLGASAAATGSIALGGCIEAPGFETQSAWRNPPVVENRPDAVYVPASIEGMGTYGTATDAGYAFLLTYTYPHRFWTVSGRRTNRVVVEDDDSLHLMVTPFDPTTGFVLPLDTSLEITREGETVDERSLWPMLSQRMGFHYGDNAALPENGTYMATIRAGPVGANRFGAFAGRFEAPAAATIEFEYDTDAVYDLSFEMINEERRGNRGAIPLMDHAGGGHSDGDGNGDGAESSGAGNESHDDHDGSGAHDGIDSSPERNGHGGPDGSGIATPTSVAPVVADLPGTVIGTRESGDAEFAVTVLGGETPSRFVGDGQAYLAVSPRSPYNRITLPFTSVSARVLRGDKAIFEGPLAAGIDNRLGYHYGAALELLRAGDALTVSIDTPPQAARHGGYETAFFGMGSIELSV